MKIENKGEILLVLAGIFLLMFFLNALMPIHRDDYDYSMIWMTTEHLGSLQDVFTSAHRHYFLHGGRMMTVFGLDLFLYLGKLWFDIANALFFTALVVLIYFHACRRASFENGAGLLAVAGVLSWLSFPHFGEVAIWKSGSTVYLWSAVTVLLFLLPYNLSLAESMKKSSVLLAVGMFLLGIVAGWSVENFAVTAVIVSAGCTFYFFRRGEMKPWMAAGVLGAVLGFLGLLLAPGNFVRYDQQDHGILRHFSNQLAGNGEMILYLLPAILLALIAWRFLQREVLRGKGISLVAELPRRGWKRFLLPGFTVLILVSYFTNSFVARAIHDALLAAVLTPLHYTDAKTLLHWSNLMKGFEEVAVYWLMVFLFYGRVKEKCGLTPLNIRLLKENAKPSEVLQRFPAVRYSAAVVLLAFFNNFVMIAAPTFPVRATFGSVALILAAICALLVIPEVQQGMKKTEAGRMLRNGAAVLGIFTFAAASVIMYKVYQADALRVQWAKEAAAAGQQVVTFPAYGDDFNRALRHVYYEDYDNNVTKVGFCKYYGLKDVLVDKK